MQNFNLFVRIRIHILMLPWDAGSISAFLLDAVGKSRGFDWFAKPSLCNGAESSFVDSVHGHMIDSRSLICGIYIGTPFPYVAMN